MNKVRILLCMLLCTLFLCACVKNEPELIKPANFYYCNQEVSYNTPTGIISPEVREASGISENDIVHYLEEYLKGPVSDSLYSIIPEKTRLLSVQIYGTTADIDFSKEFSNLSGIDLTRAAVCIVKSLHDFAGIETVILSADGSLLNEKDYFILSMEEIISMDTAAMEE